MVQQPWNKIPERVGIVLNGTEILERYQSASKVEPTQSAVDRGREKCRNRSEPERGNHDPAVAPPRTGTEATDHGEQIRDTLPE